MIIESIDHPEARVKTEGVLYVPLLQAALKRHTTHCVSTFFLRLTCCHTVHSWSSVANFQQLVSWKKALEVKISAGLHHLLAMHKLHQTRWCTGSFPLCCVVLSGSLIIDESSCFHRGLEEKLVAARRAVLKLLA